MRIDEGGVGYHINLHASLLHLCEHLLSHLRLVGTHVREHQRVEQLDRVTEL
jgi:hypothetical protein